MRTLPVRHTIDSFLGFIRSQTYAVDVNRAVGLDNRHRWNPILRCVVLGAIALLTIACAGPSATRPRRSPSPPPAVVNAAQNAVSGNDGRDVQEPVQWVRTTNHAAASIMDGETPANDEEYIIEIRGRFTYNEYSGPGDSIPTCRVLVLTVPVDAATAHFSEGLDCEMHVSPLSVLGHVHTFRL